jgi:hypothetical protein
LITALGDLFLRDETGAILRLDTCSGLLGQVADFADKRFFPQLVRRLQAIGMGLGPGQCYGYKLPSVVGGATEVANMEPTNLSLHCGLFGQLHRGLKALPEGTPIHRFVST